MNQPEQESWWSRNWKWVVPAGCVTMIVLIAAFVLGVMTLVSGVMKKSDAYAEAMARARANPAVIEKLGEPLESGFFMTGSININGPSGDANIAIPISGPKGKGTIFVEAHKSAGEWSYRTLVVEVKATKERIDLLAKVEPEKTVEEPAPNP